MWMLIFFGMLIGVLAAVNETAGLTTALVGLLFALIGGSCIGWYRGVAADGAAAGQGQLTPTQVLAVAQGAGYIALGGIVGLLLGFGLKTVDLLLIRPNVPLTKREVALDELSKQVMDLKARLETTPPGTGHPGVTADLGRKIDEILGKISKLPTDGKLLPSVVNTQSATAPELRNLSEKLKTAAEAPGAADADRLKKLSSDVGKLADALELLKTYTPADRNNLPADVRDDFNRLLPLTPPAK